MGLENRAASTYVNISKGLFTTGSNKNDNLMTHKTLSGFITDIRFTDEVYDEKPYVKMHLHMKDGEDEFILGTNATNRYAGRILRILPNIDFSQRVEIKLFYKEEGAKKDASAFIKQGSDDIKQFWSKDDPKELPPAETYATPEKEVNWSFKKQNEYLKDYTLGQVKPLMLAAANAPDDEYQDRGSSQDEVPDFEDGDPPF